MITYINYCNKRDKKEINLKKLFILTISIILLIFISVSAYAQGNTYDVEELNLKITAPDGWIALTRTLEEDDINLQKLGVDKQALVDFLLQSNIYANFMTEDQTLEIIVTMVQNKDVQKVFDFNELNDKQLKEFADAMVGMDSDEIINAIDEQSDVAVEAYSDISISGYDKYKHEQATFVVLENHKEINGVPVCGKQYITTINGHMISVSLNSIGSEVTDEADQALKDTVDSIAFTKVEKKPKQGIDLYKAVGEGLIGACVFGGGGLLVFLINNRRKKKEANGQDSE